MSSAGFTIDKDSNFSAEDLALEVFKSAFAASQCVGMGFLHAHRQLPSDEEMKKTIFEERNGIKEINTDYVLGRMMKTLITVEKNTVKVYPKKPNPDYQSWGSKFKDADDLIMEALVNLSNRNKL